MYGEDGPKEPWYLTRRCPIFCNPCRAAYEAVYPARKPVLLCSVAVWILGFIVFLAVILTCIAVGCSGVTAGLLPLAFIFMWLGYMFFHCAWAAYLLDESDVYVNRSQNPDHARLEEKHHTDIPLKVKVFSTLEDGGEDGDNPSGPGYWQFVEQPAWQAVSTRVPLN